jgi:hypothetical protein
MRNKMATMVLAALTMAAVGCHGAACGGCPDYETCDVAANACVLNRGVRFDLYATHGRVDGDNWDPFFGPPDPFICVTPAGDMELCTTIDSDTHSPKWNEQVAVDLDGDTLATRPIAVRYEDSDLDSPDQICAATVMFTPELIHLGGMTFNCSSQANAVLELRATNEGTSPLAATP